jgi:hypothetical protein
MDARIKFFEIVKRFRGQEIRSKNHCVFRFETGAQVVVAKTPSDYRSWDNAVSTLRRELGLTPTLGRVGQRRSRRVKQRSSPPPMRSVHIRNEEIEFQTAMTALGVKRAAWR